MAFHRENTLHQFGEKVPFTYVSLAHVSLPFAPSVRFRALAAVLSWPLCEVHLQNHGPVDEEGPGLFFTFSAISADR
jgi:hypothetical protein